MIAASLVAVRVSSGAGAARDSHAGRSACENNVLLECRGSHRYGRGDDMTHMCDGQSVLCIALIEQEKERKPYFPGTKSEDSVRSSMACTGSRIRTHEAF